MTCAAVSCRPTSAALGGTVLCCGCRWCFAFLFIAAAAVITAVCVDDGLGFHVSLTLLLPFCPRYFERCSTFPFRSMSGWTWNTPEEKFRLQIDHFGKISTAYRATGEFLSGKVHFPPVPPDSRRVNGRIHRSLSCDCSEMPIHGPHGDKHSADGAADRWHEARRSAREIIGEGRCPG